MKVSFNVDDKNKGTIECKCLRHENRFGIMIGAGACQEFCEHFTGVNYASMTVNCNHPNVEKLSTIKGENH